MTKVCNQCLLTKDQPSFYKRKEGRLSHICKECHRSNTNEKWTTEKRPAYLERVYGLTTDDYNNLLNKQNNVCAICKQKPEDKQELCVDHCHTTGNIRGLLCRKCNLGISNLQENEQFILSAADYLVQSKAVPTTVINLLAGSGVGKSTTAAGLYSEMKQQEIEVELVREWVKTWAYEGRKITQLDQPYIFAKQSGLEYDCYGHVPYVITDSPVLLGPAYELFYNNNSIVKDTVFKYLEHVKEKDVTHLYYLLKRNKEFNPNGRYETEEQAKQFDDFLEKKLIEWKIPYTVISCEDRERVNEILKKLQLV